MDRAEDERSIPEPEADPPEPQPGVTAPLDHVTDEEEKMEPTGVMPGAGPEGDEETETSGADRPAEDDSEEKNQQQ